MDNNLLIVPEAKRSREDIVEKFVEDQSDQNICCDEAKKEIDVNQLITMTEYQKAKRPSSDSGVISDGALPAESSEQSKEKPRQRKLTLTVTDIPLRPALLPLAEPSSLPDSPIVKTQPAVEVNQNAPAPVQSKMILESKIVELPTTCQTDEEGDSESCSNFGSLLRRDSFQIDTDPIDSFHERKRYVRTPSVVVSDYSDEILCGITLEELQFFRNQRKASLGVWSRDSDSPCSSNVSFAGSASSLSDDNTRRSSDGSQK